MKPQPKAGTQCSCCSGVLPCSQLLLSFLSFLIEFVMIAVINGDTDIDSPKMCYRKLTEK